MAAATLRNATVRAIPAILLSTMAPTANPSVDPLGEMAKEFSADAMVSRARRAANGTAAAAVVATTQDAETSFDYSDPLGPLQSGVWAQIFYACMFILSFVLIVIQLYSCILSRRMRNEGLRYHTFFISVMNLVQLFFYADVAPNSPWQDYLRNVKITVNQTAIEQITLSAFPASITFLVPLYLVTYSSPSLRSSFFFKWFIWCTLYFVLAGVFLIMAFLYVYHLKGNGSAPLNSEIAAFQFYINIASYITLLYSFICGMLGCLCMCGWATSNCASIDKKELSDKFSDNVSLNMLWFYIFTVSIFYIPKNIMNMSGYFMSTVLPKIMPIITELMSSASTPAAGTAATSGLAAASSAGAAAAAPTGSASIMTTLVQYINVIDWIVNFIPISELMLPIVEFVASNVFINMYRENFLHLLSCGACYRSDMPGSVWNLVPDRLRNIYPLEALRWANPAMVSDGLVPPPPPGYAGGVPAQVLTDGKGNVVVEI